MFKKSKIKIVSSFMMCFAVLTLSVYSDNTTQNAEAVEEVYTAKAPGLIDLYSLTCSADVKKLYITATTNGNERMSEIGLKNIRIERSSDEINWTVEKDLSDMTVEGDSVYNLSKKSFSVDGDYYYRVTLEHYAKENTIFFPREQTVTNTSAPVFIESQEPYNIVSLEKSILEEDVAIDDDTIVPAGTTAFSVNIDDNRGYSLFEFLFDIGSGYDVLKDAEGRPIFTKAPTNTHSMFVDGSENNGKIALNGLCFYDCLTQGNNFTFYANEIEKSETEPVIISRKLYSSEKWHECGSGTDYLAAGCPLLYKDKVVNINTITDGDSYMVGDINGDMKIDIIDAFDYFYTTDMSAFNNSFSLLVALTDDFAPNVADVRAFFLWNDADATDDELLDCGHLPNANAHEILKYCADISVGKLPETDSYISEIRTKRTPRNSMYLIYK